jgi:hypothetical protein
MDTDVVAGSSPHKTFLDWARWVKGPFVTMVGNPEYTPKLVEAGIEFEERLAEADFKFDKLRSLAVEVSVELTSTSLHQAFGMYLVRKRLFPDVPQGMFVLPPWLQASAHLDVKDSVAGGIPMGSAQAIGLEQRVSDLTAMLQASNLEAERLRRDAVPPLTMKEFDKLVGQPLPYVWMSTLAGSLRRLGPGGWQGNELAQVVWGILVEEVRAKRQGRTSVKGVSQGTPGAPASACFTCGQPGHWSSSCPSKRHVGSSGHTPGVAEQNSYVSRSGMVFDQSALPPSPCLQCGRWHWAHGGCPYAPNMGGTAQPPAHQVAPMQTVQPFGNQHTGTFPQQFQQVQPTVLPFGNPSL